MVGQGSSAVATAVGIELPDLALPLADGSVPLSVASAARRLGVAPPTLRTWDRRYGLGPSAHEPGAHRRYTARDLARLEHMRRLVHAGVGPAEAARLAMAGEPDSESVDSTALDADQHGAADRHRVVPLARRPAVHAALRRAARSLDAEGITQLLHAQLSRRGVVSTWDDVLVPLLGDLGRTWESTGEGVEIEHLVSGCVQGALVAHAGGRAVSAGDRTVLLASAQDEQHSLPLAALGAALAERSVAVDVLGARLPRAALAAAVRRVAPFAVFVWSQSRATGDIGAAVADIPAVRPAPLVVLGGPGWWGEPPARASARVHRVDHLSGAVELLSGAAR